MSTTELVYGWLIGLVVVGLNTALSLQLMRDKRTVLALLLLLAVPMFIGHALAMVGVNLLGGAS